MRQRLSDSWVALFELILVILCGVTWMIDPQWGGWIILIALSLFLLKVFTGNLRFIALDWLILLFFVTTWIGYWAAYDQAMAWNKACFIVIGILLFYSLRGQPNENLIAVSTLFFTIGVGVSIYYFLTYDFVAAPRRLEFVNSIGRWFMSVRPHTNWTTIHPNYVAGIAAITAPFIFYPISKNISDKKNSINWVYVFAAVGLSVVFLALLMATSRGIVLSIASGVGGWFLWRITQLNGIRHRLKCEAAFPILLFLYIGAVITVLYLGPAQIGGAITDTTFYGTGSRAELFSRSLFLVGDYPLIGGGLGSFPGLYSQYLLGIPYFYLPNAHNLFLDVTIEQGLFGGVAFLIMYIVSVWKVAGSITRDNGQQIFQWIVLFSLTVAVIHGMVDDYLYNGAGAVFSLFLVGLSLNNYQYKQSVVRKLDVLTVGIIIVIWAAIVLVNLNSVRSTWYTNLGAVQLAKVELTGFPNNGWAGNDIIPKLDVAESTFHSSLQFDPTNRTANHRLGMIAMYRMDFEAAESYLEVAHMQAPNHRGVVKSLGYSYLWSGDFQKAQLLLAQIPEVEQELNVYKWWWSSRGRNDLSDMASLVLKNMNMTVSNP